MNPGPRATELPVGHVRWIIAGLLFLETILNYTDLQTLSVVAPVLSRQLHMSGTDYAHITQAFEIGYIITFVLGGWLFDRISVRWGMALALAWWSAAEMMHASAGSIHGLILWRFLFGLAYPGAYLAAAKVISEWFAPGERAFVTGIYTAGAAVGATVAPPLISQITLAFSWRAAFLFTGGAGCLYLLIWLIVYHTPERHPWLSSRERSYVLAARAERVPSPAPAGAPPLRTILCSRYFWGVALGRMVGDNPWIFYVLWVPIFLSQQYGFSLKEIGLLGWIPFLFADLGSLSGGWVSGYLIRRGWNVMRARLFVMGAAAAVLAFTFTLGLVGARAAILALLSLMMFCTMCWMVNISTIPVDTFPDHLLGRVVGLTTAAAIFGQILLSFAIGASFDHHRFISLFVGMSLMGPVGFLIARAWMGGSANPSVSDPLTASTRTA